MFKCFATTNKGLEELLILEFKEYNIINIIKYNAGIQFDATLNQIMQLNLMSRYASRILIRLTEALYNNENDIYDIAYNINWLDWFTADKTIKIKTSAINCPLKSLDFVTLKTKDAICDYFVAKMNTRPNVDKINPDIRIYNFLSHDKLSIYIDTSKEALFKRGYRIQNKLDAPLKENLAAGLIKLSNWTSDMPLYDPMCGTGTILIEALFIAMNIPPNYKRNFAFANLKPFDMSDWKIIKNQALEKIIPNPKLQLFANDINKNVLDIFKKNLDTLEFKNIKNYIQFSNQNILDYIPKCPHGILLTNPPYGIRLADTAYLQTLFPKIATHLKNNFTNWNCFFLSNDLNLPKYMRLKPTHKIPVFNGDLNCRLFEFKIVKGSNR